MVITTEDIVIEVSTSCNCTYCPACSLGTNGWDPCSECGGEVTYSEECFDCQPFDWAEEKFEEWASGCRKVRIDGRNMGWQHRSGYAVTAANWKSFLNTMTFNGDWTLKLTFTPDGQLKVRRSSHDEPTGASFEVTRCVFLADTMDMDEAIHHEILDEYGCHIKCGEYFYDCECGS